MANALPKNIQAKVKRAVYKKADEFGYMECGRIESGRFLDILVDDPDVGKIIIEYMPKERVRTYIKDGILNAYTKAATKRALAGSTPANTIQTVFNETGARKSLNCICWRRTCQSSFCSRLGICIKDSIFNVGSNSLFGHILDNDFADIGIIN